jgi:hypothetical protein
MNAEFYSLTGRAPRRPGFVATGSVTGKTRDRKTLGRAGSPWYPGIVD